jgi:hypothetical protein
VAIAASTSDSRSGPDPSDDWRWLHAPAGTIVFVRDPALIRFARATADQTAIFMVGGPADVPYTVSRWEQALP